MKKTVLNERNEKGKNRQTKKSVINKIVCSYAERSKVFQNKNVVDIFCVDFIIDAAYLMLAYVFCCLFFLFLIKHFFFIYFK